MSNLFSDIPEPLFSMRNGEKDRKGLLTDINSKMKIDILHNK